MYIYILIHYIICIYIKYDVRLPTCPSIRTDTFYTHSHKFSLYLLARHLGQPQKELQ